MIGPLTEAQIARVKYEMPVSAVLILDDISPVSLALYRTENGAKFVTLVNGSEDAWESYVGWTLAGKRKVAS